MPLDWTPLVDVVSRCDRLLLLTHVRPDGDALGSQFGLADALEQLGKTARVVIGSRLYDTYAFMKALGPVERFAPPGDHFRDAQAVVVLDTGTWNQLGECGPFLQTLNVPKFVIDHHRTQDDLGATRLVDVSAEATGRLVFEARRALGVPMTLRAAKALFVALATDTGWFRHASTTAATFDLAAELVRGGANPTEIYGELFEQNTLPRLRLTGRVLEQMQLALKGRVAFTEVHLSDYGATGSLPQDTEDLVNYTRTMQGVTIGLLFIEQPEGGVKVSFRSRGPDVSKLAERFGGGGHKLAAGATVPGTVAEVRTRVLEAVAEVLSRPE